jgi:3',5'-cyclic AMP phosphodiesterase CpdA
MGSVLRFAFTADLHWGINPRGDEATRLLVRFLQSSPPDVLVLAGDVGADEDFAPCLELFASLPCRKALVPGNHDIWVRDDDPRGDSLQVYQNHLPRLCAAHGFHYLDHGPLSLPEADVSLVGSMNWYDYSWSLDVLKQYASDWEERLRTKRFTRGRHNDARFVQWSLDDVRFTAQSVTACEQHLQQALAAAARAIVVTHHPPYYGLSFPRPPLPISLDALLWDAFGGNRSMEELLVRNAERISFAFCGHTHRARENELHGIRGYNIGGDYHFKRLLVLDWPTGTVEAHQFGNPEA